MYLHALVQRLKQCFHTINYRILIHSQSIMNYIILQLVMYNITKLQITHTLIVIQTKTKKLQNKTKKCNILI